MSFRFVFGNRNQTLPALCQELKISEKELVSAEQVHGDSFAKVTRGAKGTRVLGVDALITTENGLPLVIRTADCAPLVIFDQVREQLAVIHAGRKGTELGITAKVLQEVGTRDWGRVIAKIGPCIGPCCYPTDIKEKNIEQLLAAGVPRENIEVNGLCTKCHKEEYYSYRGDGPDTGRNYLVAVISH